MDNHKYGHHKRIEYSTAFELSVVNRLKKKGGDKTKEKKEKFKTSEFEITGFSCE